MLKQIHMQNVGIYAKNQKIFDNFTFDFTEGKNVCLIGEEGVGKTLLLRAILGEENFTGDILKEASCRGITKSTVKIEDSIEHYLNYDELSSQDKKLVKAFLNLKSLSYSFSKLTKKFQLKVMILKQVLMKPKFFFLDDVLSIFNMKERKELFQLFENTQITLFYVTSDLEDAILFPYLVIMGKKGILMEGSTLSVLKEEKIMKRLGFSLPFFVDLSLQLQSYGLIDKVYLEGKELTNHLWKSN
ncbi:MAG: ATP-binding cassette domain-containing protein [Bacilli bacterium]|nr:ATP-binding cassette domain-containing protein [Bacilli bacterium]